PGATPRPILGGGPREVKGCESRALGGSRGDLGPYVAWRGSRLTECVFLSQEVTLPLSFAVARTRLLCLTRDGSLGTVSGEAFTDGRGDALGYGPFGEVPDASTLVRVQFADPAPHEDLLVLPLRWEAMAPSGRLFPVLDADVTLLPLAGPPTMGGAPAVSDETRLVVAGSYRPPTDGLGSMVGTEDLQHIAAATICSLLHKIA